LHLVFGYNKIYFMEKPSGAKQKYNGPPPEESYDPSKVDMDRGWRESGTDRIIEFAAAGLVYCAVLAYRKGQHVGPLKYVRDEFPDPYLVLARAKEISIESGVPEIGARMGIDEETSRRKSLAAGREIVVFSDIMPDVNPTPVLEAA
jgi:hypothetical protein